MEFGDSEPGYFLQHKQQAKRKNVCFVVVRSKNRFNKQRREKGTKWNKMTTRENEEEGKNTLHTLVNECVLYFSWFLPNLECVLE